MFDNVLERGAVARTRALGGTVSLALHGAILAAAVWMGTRVTAPAPVVTPAPVLLFRPALPKAALPAPAPAPAAPQHHRAVHHPPRHLVVPREVPKQPPPEVAPTPQPETIDEADETGPDNGATSGVGPGVPSGIPGGGAPAAEEPTYVLGDGMTAPRLQPDASAPFRWTRAQLDARVEGLCLAQCTLTSAGVLRDCRILKRVAGVDDAQVLEYLAGLRFTPAMQGARPISIRSYTVPLRLKVP